jgi:hypothetical protein
VAVCRASCTAKILLYSESQISDYNWELLNFPPILDLKVVIMHRKEINSVIFLGDCLETKKRGFREGVDDGGEIRQGNYGFYCNNDLEIDSFEESG